MKRGRPKSTKWRVYKPTIEQWCDTCRTYRRFELSRETTKEETYRCPDCGTVVTFTVK